MNSRFELKMNSTNKILESHGLQNNGKAEEFLRNEVDRYSDPYVPFLESTLKNNKSYPSNHSIRYNSPYARYQYHGKVMAGKPPKQVTDKDLQYNGAPKRGAKWDIRMWNDKRKEICNNLERYVKAGG